MSSMVPEAISFHERTFRQSRAAQWKMSDSIRPQLWRAWAGFVPRLRISRRHSVLCRCKARGRDCAQSRRTSFRYWDQIRKPRTSFMRAVTPGTEYFSLPSLAMWWQRCWSTNPFCTTCHNFARNAFKVDSRDHERSVIPDHGPPPVGAPARAQAAVAQGEGARRTQLHTAQAFDARVGPPFGVRRGPLSER